MYTVAKGKAINTEWRNKILRRDKILRSDKIIRKDTSNVIQTRRTVNKDRSSEAKLSSSTNNFGENKIGTNQRRKEIKYSKFTSQDRLNESVYFARVLFFITYPVRNIYQFREENPFKSLELLAYVVGSLEKINHKSEGNE